MASFRIKYLATETDIVWAQGATVVEEIIPDGEFDSIEEVRENYGNIYELEEIKEGDK